MLWFIFALVSLFGWGAADLFYKKGTDEEDKYSHLKIAVWVGLVMGVCAAVLIPFSESTGDFRTFIRNAVSYFPASLSYIISMVIGYAGLRYLELSIVSPVQNASGGLSAVCMIVYFVASGRFSSVWDEFGVLDIAGTLLVVAGVIALAIAEQKLSKDESDTGGENRKYRFGALALLFPLAYCIFDTVGTAADGIILDEETGLGLGEIDVIILYGFTFFIAGLCCWLYMLIKTKKPYNLFSVKEADKGIAAVCEEFGQVFYVYAMAEKPVLAAPIIASYCIVSIILSRIFLRENIGRERYLCIGTVVLGIVLLGISEGLA